MESNNWQLDVTFGEDRVQVKNGNQAQIMGKLRCFAMNLLRWSKTGSKNLQACIEKFSDSPGNGQFHGLHIRSLPHRQLRKSESTPHSRQIYGAN